MSYIPDPGAATRTDRRPIAPLQILLAVVMVVFCGILVFVYVATKRANPVMLDQQGKPLDRHSDSAQPGAR